LAKNTGIEIEETRFFHFRQSKRASDLSFR
jgi:hypothetical protein